MAKMVRKGVKVDGLSGSCHRHAGLTGVSKPERRGQRNWWCLDCKGFVIGPGGKVAPSDLR
jgi:hypothetical protein